MLDFAKEKEKKFDKKRMSKNKFIKKCHEEDALERSTRREGNNNESNKKNKIKMKQMIGERK